MVRHENLRNVLEQTGLLDEKQLRDVLDRRRDGEGSLVEVVTSAGYADEKPFLQALAAALNIPFVEAGLMEIEREVLDSLPTKAVFQYNAIPIGQSDGRLQVAVRDPFASGLADALRLAAGRRVSLALSTADDLARAAKRFYGVGAETLDRLIQDDRIDLSVDEAPGREDVSELAQEASVVKFVNQVIWEAFQDRATDIHIEPMELDLRVRYRVDGVLHSAPVPPQLKRFQAAIISRIKVMSGMDIAERRLPQDGRISLRVRGEEIDVRVSTMPTVYGESVSLRLLMRSSGMLGMDSLGLSRKDEQLLKHEIHKPHGILLVTGPTGSGKSTSLYAWLHTINTVDKRIITVEDPIEYEMAGINQIHVKPDIGLTFAVGLRHILRQDPDVIMVGEIRDRETAEIAIRAALTGHLVFSTLHTNDAAGGVTRLLDMGIEPFLVSSSIEGIIAQRLVRRLCRNCRQPAEINRESLEAARFPLPRLAEGRLFRAVGCDQCRNSGFSGRTGIYEILMMTDNLRAMVVERASANAIKSEALRQGMHTLREDGWDKVLAGTTTVEEVLRVSEEE